MPLSPPPLKEMTNGSVREPRAKSPVRENRAKSALREARLKESRTSKSLCQIVVTIGNANQLSSEGPQLYSTGGEFASLRAHAFVVGCAGPR